MSRKIIGRRMNKAQPCSPPPSTSASPVGEAGRLVFGSRAGRGAVRRGTAGLASDSDNQPAAAEVAFSGRTKIPGWRPNAGPSAC